MTLFVSRNNEKLSNLVEYEINENVITILDALNYIKENIDSTLSYRSGCKSGICGSCSVLVNGRESLACKCKSNDKDEIKPLKNSKILKDLVIDLQTIDNLLSDCKTYIETNSNENIVKKDEKLIDIQSNCILCQSCYSSCPVYEVNKEFKGPYALTRTLRYINDKKESNISKKLEIIQNNGIWDCTLCGNCTLACPQYIDPKTDIMNLRMKSIQNGYSDPNVQTDNFLNEFEFGFNPNSF